MDEERKPHDPSDPRGGGGVAGGPGTDAQALWKKYQTAKDAGETKEPERHMSRPLASDEDR